MTSPRRDLTPVPTPYGRGGISRQAEVRTRMKSFLVLLAVGIVATSDCSRPKPFTGEDLLGSSSQHVLVIAEAERDSVGSLYRYASEGGRWRMVGSPRPVSLGAGGVGKVKEGDRRAPSGAYPLASAFGYADTAPAGLKMPYLPLKPETECVDDESSTHYNQVVNPSELRGGKGWNSSEMMRRDLHNKDDLYKLGLLVDYNPDGHRDPGSGKGAGSCIFLHIWRGADRPTVGCTAMTEDDMVTLLAWLDPAGKPLLVQGSREELERMARTGKLPYPLPPKRLLATGVAGSAVGS